MKPTDQEWRNLFAEQLELTLEMVRSCRQLARMEKVDEATLARQDARYRDLMQRHHDLQMRAAQPLG